MKTKPAKKKKPLTVYLSDKTKKRLELVAASNERSMSAEASVIISFKMGTR
jgi:plasmid stability protein